jgi:hypothetical protein
MRSARGPMLLCVMMLCAAPLAAQTPQQDQFWPELDYYQRFSDHTRLFASAQWSLNGLPGQQDQQYAVAMDLFFAKRFLLADPRGAQALQEDRREWTQLRLGYKYAQALSTDSSSVTNRLFAEITFRDELWGFFAADRNGYDWRWVNGTYSNRYRNRLDLQHPASLSHYHFTPYSNCEWVYVVGRSGWNSVKCEIGAQLPVLPHVTTIPYFGLVNVWQGNPLYTRAFGLTLVASF